PTQPFKLFAPRKKGLEYEINHKGNTFYLKTNKDAPNFKIMVCDEKNTAIAAWKDFIPYSDATLTEDFDLFDDYIVISERKNGLSQLRVLNVKNNVSYYIEFND